MRKARTSVRAITRNELLALVPSGCAALFAEKLCFSDGVPLSTNAAPPPAA